jgi:hypothetical protein
VLIEREMRKKIEEKKPADDENPCRDMRENTDGTTQMSRHIKRTKRI